MTEIAVIVIGLLVIALLVARRNGAFTDPRENAANRFPWRRSSPTQSSVDAQVPKPGFWVSPGHPSDFSGGGDGGGSGS